MRASSKTVLVLCLLTVIGLVLAAPGPLVTAEGAQELPILAAIDQGLVTASYEATGYASGNIGTLSLTSASSSPVTLDIANSGMVGMVLSNPSDKEQDEIIADLPGVSVGPTTYRPADNVTIGPGETVDLPILGFCINFEKKSPSDGRTFTLQATSSRTDITPVKRVLRALENTTFPADFTPTRIDKLEQIAVWMSQPENAEQTSGDYSERGYPVAQGDKPFITDILNRSGVDQSGLVALTGEGKEEGFPWTPVLLVAVVVIAGIVAAAGVSRARAGKPAPKPKSHVEVLSGRPPAGAGTEALAGGPVCNCNRIIIPEEDDVAAKAGGPVCNCNRIIIPEETTPAALAGGPVCNCNRIIIPEEDDVAAKAGGPVCNCNRIIIPEQTTPAALAGGPVCNCNRIIIPEETTPAALAGGPVCNCNRIIIPEETPAAQVVAPRPDGYSTRTDSGGSTTVRFGDGMPGDRLPSGSTSVTAAPRGGTGPVGNADAGSVASLHTRPPDSSRVANPIPSKGGAEAEGASEGSGRVPQHRATAHGATIPEKEAAEALAGGPVCNCNRIIIPEETSPAALTGGPVCNCNRIIIPEETSPAALAGGPVCNCNRIIIPEEDDVAAKAGGPVCNCNRIIIPEEDDVA